jgi:hypothetical protein
MAGALQRTKPHPPYKPPTIDRLYRGKTDYAKAAAEIIKPGCVENGIIKFEYICGILIEIYPLFGTAGKIALLAGRNNPILVLINPGYQARLFLVFLLLFVRSFSTCFLASSTLSRRCLDKITCCACANS